MKKVCILTEGGGNIGMGHISRCLSIYQAFEIRGYFPEIIINANEPFKNALNEIRYQLFDWIADLDALIQRISEAEIVLIDSYRCPLSLHQQIAKFCKKSVFIDDNVRLEYPTGIVVNGILGAEKLNYPKSTNIDYLLGAQYSFLRSAFWDISPRTVNKIVKSVMISCGGNDEELSTRIVKFLLERFPDLNISVVLKDLFTNDVSYLKNNSNVFSDLSADEMRALMSESDIAISAAGQTTYELCRLGTPFIALLTADNQKFSIANFYKSGLVQEAINPNNINFEALLTDQFNYLLNANIRTLLSNKMQASISGHGPLKLVDYIIEHSTLN